MEIYWIRALEEEIVPQQYELHVAMAMNKKIALQLFSNWSFFKLKSFQTAGEIKDFCSYYPKCLRFDWECKEMHEKCVLGGQNQTHSHTKFWEFHDTYPSSVLQFGSLENSS